MFLAKFSILVYLTFCLVINISEAVPNLSISSSRVPNIQYEADAIETLRESYILYPDDANVEKRLESFSNLFQNKHALSTGWNVVAGCTATYNPKTTIYININVQEGATSKIIKISN